MPFSSLVGHTRIAALLSRAIGRGTLPPTLLFVGPAGIGKWRAAMATAAAVNCLQPVHTGLAVDACGTCRSCDRIGRGVHVDVMAVEPDDKASIKIDVIREVLSRTGYRPFEGRLRVVLIREADALEDQAQNALLKNLEEPPPGTMFILTTAVPGALLATVRSRAMRLRFGRLTTAEVMQALEQYHEHEPAEARAAAVLADGSIGQALALGSSDLAVLRETAMLLLQQTANRIDMPGRLQAAAAVVTGMSKKERTRQEIGVILRLTASMLRDIEAINSGADLLVLANPVSVDDLSALARSFAGDRARTAFSAVDRALSALDRNAGPKVVAEWVASQI